LAHQEPFLRQPIPVGETREQRRKRAPQQRETDIWVRAVRAIGRAPWGCTWVHVGDRTSDIFTFMRVCREKGCHFVLRAAQDRCIKGKEGEEPKHLFAWARALPPADERFLTLPARHGQPARTAHLLLSFAPLHLLAPRYGEEKGAPPLPVFVVRVWEVDAGP